MMGVIRFEYGHGRGEESKELTKTLDSEKQVWHSNQSRDGFKELEQTVFFLIFISL